MSDVLSLVSSLKSDVQRLSARVDDFERRQSAERDLDRVLSVAEAARAIGKAPVTLRHWLGDVQLFRRYQLAALVRKDPTNHWVSSPRLVARWKQVMFRALQEVCR
jgi:hypothetical protein